MIFGVGIDVENHHRFIKYATLAEQEKLSLFYTPQEIENYASFDSHLCYAISFSGKEAFYKAFSSGQSSFIPSLTDVEIFFKDEPPGGKLEIAFSGNASEIIEKYKIDLPAEYNYSIEENFVIFETILLCNPE